MTWHNCKEFYPQRKRGSDFSERVRVRVLYKGKQFEMEGAACWANPAGLWVLFNFPEGYGGGAHADGSEKHPAKVVAWALLEQ